jgi:transcriptional regulator with XRE-family HTH domain
VGQRSTESTGVPDRMARADEGGAAATAPDALPRRALRHSPEALRWVRQQRSWTRAELAQASALAVSTVTGLENGSRTAGPIVLAKLAKALECPQVVLEAGPIDAVATSVISALDLLTRLLQISDPAHLTRHRGFVQLGFVASGRNIGTLHVQENDFDQLVSALRRHFPNRHDCNSTRHHLANSTTNRTRTVENSSTDAIRPNG